MVNLHFIKHLVQHYWSATRIDVLHSPFIFDLYNRCIKPKTSDAGLDAVMQLRSRLLHDPRMITQQDLGAGSEMASMHQRSIAQFARRHAKPDRIAQVIYRLIDHYRYSRVIELGTSLGISASYEASAIRKHFSAADVQFTTIEGAPEIAAVAGENFRQLGLDAYIEQEVGNFDEVLPHVLNRYAQLDLCFIDGNHRYAPTMQYFRQLLPKVHNNSMLIFDDIYWSPGMTQAWEEIKQHPQVTVTVDLFFIGIVLFRKEQAKEHFKLRIL